MENFYARLGGMEYASHFVARCLIDEMGLVPIEDLRPELGLEPEDFALLTVGRARPIKRLDLLFDAVRLLRDHVPRIRCVCVGPAENLRTLARTHGVEDLVGLTGRLPAGNSYAAEPPYPHLVNAYRSADLYVSSSHFEACSLSAIDSLACGTPVIVVGKRYGARVLVRENWSGFTVEEESSTTVAKKLSELAHGRENLSRAGPAIRDSLADCSWSKVAARMVTIYESITSSA